MSYLASNRQLLDGFRAGAPQALREVYAHYAPELARALPGKLSELARPIELADALQETFTRAFSQKARLGYDGLKPYAAYLLGIARNVIVDNLRRRQLTQAVLAEVSASGPDAEPPPSPELAAEHAEAGRVVDNFVTSLNGTDRALYQARFADGKTQAEAAAALGLTRIRVRRAELRLRKRLLEHLKTAGYLEDIKMEGWAAVRLDAADPRRR